MTETEEAVARVEAEAASMEVWSKTIHASTAERARHRRNAADLRTILSALSASQAEVERLTADLKDALRQVGDYAREAGEAKGRLEMSEAAGIVDMWRDHAGAAEARATRAEALVEEAGEVLGPFASWAEDNTEVMGDVTTGAYPAWGGNRCERERIVDWFGPSDFRAARDFITKHGGGL